VAGPDVGERRDGFGGEQVAELGGRVGSAARAAWIHPGVDLEDLGAAWEDVGVVGVAGGEDDAAAVGDGGHEESGEEVVGEMVDGEAHLVAVSADLLGARELGPGVQHDRVDRGATKPFEHVAREGSDGV
jgi:hypothetical protein